MVATMEYTKNARELRTDSSSSWLSGVLSRELFMSAYVHQRIPHVLTDGCHGDRQHEDPGHKRCEPVNDANHRQGKD
uniref:Uncharacterized protein n=1 Tax=Timema poppense TaxID=170557 RepID=A0A7R9DUA5_TIMPO|nr:unnamed protein product [Timema poppensis]